MGDLRRTCRPRTGGWRDGSELGVKEGVEADGSMMVGGCGCAGDDPSWLFIASVLLNNLPKRIFADPGEQIGNHGCAHRQMSKVDVIYIFPRVESPTSTGSRIASPGRTYCPLISVFIPFLHVHCLYQLHNGA